MITPPYDVGPESVAAYRELGVTRLVVHLGSQRRERVEQRLPVIDAFVRAAEQ